MTAPVSPAPFTPLPARPPLRQAIAALTRTPEPDLLPGLLDQARLAPEASARAQALALRIAKGVRERSRDRGRAGLVQGLLQEFALSSQEGVALMCLAEALLRIPDAATRDALIRDKISRGDWQAHVGRSPSLFVNAAAWGLLLTGKLVGTHSDEGLTAALRRIVGRGGEPLVRKGVDVAMRMMGEQFVTGETIAEALQNAQPREAQGFRYSYDMLGEAALTETDAAQYLAAYEQAIDAIGAASAGRGIVAGPGISIKLSALHPRYARGQSARVMDELYPRLLALATRARRHDIGLNIDAEEADRLDLSLDLLERLCEDPALTGWHGVGFVIQGYGKRCPAVVDFLVDLARRTQRRLMVRLVKGAYWDSEIKRAQLDGQAGYPVYTRKAYTDVAYLACARKMLAAPDAIYPQFATHNAQTLAALHEMAGGADAPADRYEFQCLHGMGEPLYEQVVGPASKGGLGRPCRIYAPVGSHETLLAYLVRRLLENGANTSFVNRVADESLALATLVEDPVATVERLAAAEGAVGLPHPKIPLPLALFGAVRVNSRGLDLADDAQLAHIDAALTADAATPWTAEPLLATDAQPDPAEPVHNPADPADRVGTVQPASAADVAAALAAAEAAAPAWAAEPPARRARILEAAADVLEAATERLLPLLMREAGKTAANGVAEVREAVDFLRYDAQQLRQGWDNATHRALGPVVCISPWNFPLAIFTGQVAAALAAGNVVLAKPAEQTPLVAAEAVRLLHAAGVPRAALQLLPGRGETVGAALVADARVRGVLFTGSTEVARLLQRTLAARLNPDGQPVPLIAETGGLNAMVVDTSALPEQVVQDVIGSAFDSAGQRCSALRLLCVQREAAPRVRAMLLGAMQELRIGDPRQLATDVGPVIDDDARAGLERHIDAMRASGYAVTQPVPAPDGGCFVPPTLIDLPSPQALAREVFGPVLHLVTYEREQLPSLLAQVNAAGYGLTGGVHTRIDETVVHVAAGLRAGNLYVNRNMVGAVVGVQPFGGEGLSGTGPKAGGPLYLLRLLAACPPDAARRAVEAAGTDATAPVRGFDVVAARAGSAPQALAAWAEVHRDAALAQAVRDAVAASPAGRWRTLTGPTGEANLYAVLPRERVLCLATDDAARLHLLATVLAVGATAVWPADALALAARLPEAVRERIVTAQDPWAGTVPLDAVLHAGPAAELPALQQRLATRPGAIVGLTHVPPGASVPLERLVHERALSINTAAAGGNASLMTIG
ncbi:trifunctional transcriptional regulator/proline dehydrogenase/L-glutamate gamma-semialdehyde dehydrogenase [Rubrivivax albus]|uniref:Bifunctional protein PutA n=1 Tax=Rubrivivax albus TaxID=2499835 RepID=A0A3S2TMU0_9BURK|nr:trifunctional transcriptional regulator/proline dehydrogenase/L-glutamate gamma-semialdehyde dehydrogenase [Rubrivivax albus]RVT51561.1 trifunctional transcriptional regulator/proline dehydrogenase/L-glutamate gamma-semialdehyde dehydrogenase [Rubrivivax albus]